MRWKNIFLEIVISSLYNFVHQNIFVNPYKSMSNYTAWQLHISGYFIARYTYISPLNLHKYYKILAALDSIVKYTDYGCLTKSEYLTIPFHRWKMDIHNPCSKVWLITVEKTLFNQYNDRKCICGLFKNM